MTNEQKLQAIIEKAVKNGYTKCWLDVRTGLIKSDGWTQEVYYTLFSHDFAKAFWGEGDCDIHKGNCLQPDWQHHLQQAVLEENPIDYYYKFI